MNPFVRKLRRTIIILGLAAIALLTYLINHLPAG
jgi:hypothetical protein